MYGRKRVKAKNVKAKREAKARYFPKRKVCGLCVDHIRVIDYKDLERLRRYLSDRGRIEPRRRLGTCAKHQRAVAKALKRARHLALMPFTGAHLRDTGPVAPES